MLSKDDKTTHPETSC